MHTRTPAKNWAFVMSRFISVLGNGVHDDFRAGWCIAVDRIGCVRPIGRGGWEPGPVHCLVPWADCVTVHADAQERRVFCTSPTLESASATGLDEQQDRVPGRWRGVVPDNRTVCGLLDKGIVDEVSSGVVVH